MYEHIVYALYRKNSQLLHLLSITTERRCISSLSQTRHNYNHACRLKMCWYKCLLKHGNGHYGVWCNSAHIKIIFWIKLNILMGRHLNEICVCVPYDINIRTLRKWMNLLTLKDSNIATNNYVINISLVTAI